MGIVVDRVDTDGLGGVVHVLREWQGGGGPVPLHPGDLGWYWRFGAEATAAALRTWGRHGRTLAVGLLDGPGLLRLAVAPEAQPDAELARRMAADLTRPERGVLPGGSASVQVRRAHRSVGSCARTAGRPASRGPRCGTTSRNCWRTAARGSR